MTELQQMAELAAKYVNTTDKHIFLTGKAGTGKTTFLKYITEQTYKNAVIAAPTGIAAINAGGVTLHSLLQLPFGMFIPENINLSTSNAPVNTPRTITRDQRFNASKRKLIQELELLIIDEVSMLRADLLDCMDHMLRYLRKRRAEPFGGLQILFIGDLMQLSPVIREQEMTVLRSYYNSPYFFEARALKENPPILVELQKIYRQSNQSFIDLLNRLRHNKQTKEDLERLNSHFDPNLDAAKSEGYIHLTTHNKKADIINKTRLRDLEGEANTYYPHIEGNFPENMLPISGELILKTGAQVMFIKNDPTGQGQFFNGKIGYISHLLPDEILVRFEDGEEIEVSKYTWENKRYVLNKTTNEIDEKHLGIFEQYPLKLAWAVTVHKSQGLTFEKAILDLSDTFAPGQLYVALSRLTSLNGLVLSSPLPLNPPGIDDSLQSFSEKGQGESELRQNLGIYQKEFLLKFSNHAFRLTPLVRKLGYHEQSFNKDENRSLKQRYLDWTKALIKDTIPLMETGESFIRQVQQILIKDDYLPFLSERLGKAQAYFEKPLSDLQHRIGEHKRMIKKEKQVKVYLNELEELELLFINQNKQILKLSLLTKRAAENKILTREELMGSDTYRMAVSRKKPGSKKDKTPTAQISYELYRKGKTIPEIADERGFVTSTIEGHLAQYVEKGDLDVTELLSEKKLKKIMEKYEKGLINSSEIKSSLGDNFSYSEIKLGLAFARQLKAENNEHI
jgi:hypothetical protein